MTAINNPQSAAAILLDNWQHQTRLDRLPSALAPHDRAEAYRIASEIPMLKNVSCVGWKIAATSVAGQKHINVEGPLAGRLHADRMVKPGNTIPLANNLMRVAEVEFAFSFKYDLPRRPLLYTREEVMAAVKDLHLSIEIPDSRYHDFTVVGADQFEGACRQSNRQWCGSSGRHGQGSARRSARGTFMARQRSIALCGWH